MGSGPESGSTGASRPGKMFDPYRTTGNSSLRNFVGGTLPKGRLLSLTHLDMRAAIHVHSHASLADRN